MMHRRRHRYAWQLRIGEGVGGWIVADEYQVYMFKGKCRSGVCQL